MFTGYFHLNQILSFFIVTNNLIKFCVDQTLFFFFFRAVDLMMRIHRGILQYDSEAGRYSDFCLLSTNPNASSLISPPCANPQTILQFFYTPDQFIAAEQPPLIDDLDARVEQILNSANRDAFVELMGNQFNVEERRGRVTRAVFAFATPFPGFQDSEDRFIEQMELYTEFVRSIRDNVLFENNAADIDVRIVFLEDILLSDLFNALVFSDTIFALVAVVALFLYMWFHTGSLFLSLSAIFHILLSWSWAVFVYLFIFQISTFPFLNVLGVYIVLGIGADDVFIYLDAWKQSKKIKAVNATTETRMAWTFSKASTAMLITSLTTAVAFIINASSAVIVYSLCFIYSFILCVPPFVLFFHHQRFFFFLTNVVYFLSLYNATTNTFRIH